MLTTLLDKDYISESTSSFDVLCFFVRKPHGDGLRLVVDWRNLKNNTLKDQTQLPKLVDLLAQLGLARIFSVLDGNCVYWQMLTNTAARNKTTFAQRLEHLSGTS
jgi:hypothetical protein